MPEPSPALPAGWQLISLERTDSTNAEALRRVASGAGAGTVVIAAEQSAGRGRQGRPWQSSAGNLHLSLVARPAPGRIVGQLSFVAALAVTEALAALVHEATKLRLKWPNDILHDDAKLAGILIEGAGNELFVVGIGINLASAPDLPDRRTVALTDLGKSIIPEDIAGPICHAFAHWSDIWRRDGFAPLRAAWLDRAFGLGEELSARLPARTLSGRFDGLDPDGALILALPDGRRETISSGEVFFAEAV